MVQHVAQARMSGRVSLLARDPGNWEAPDESHVRFNGDFSATLKPCTQRTTTPWPLIILINGKAGIHGIARNANIYNAFVDVHRQTLIIRNSFSYPPWFYHNYKHTNINNTYYYYCYKTYAKTIPL